jgi:hypothetical protein
MIKQLLLMLKQAVQTFVKFMNFHQFKTRAQKFVQRACVVPVPVKTPLTARVNQTVTTKGLDNDVPTRSFAV